MSILSGIGQIPAVFGTGGGASNAVIYQLPADINVLASAGNTAYFVNNLPVTDGTYLVLFVVDLVAGDNTTTITTARLACTSGIGFTQATAIYNTTLINGQPYTMSVSGIVDVVGGLVGLEYEIDQNGNTSTLTMPEYDANTQSGVIYLLPIVPPQ